MAWPLDRIDFDCDLSRDCPWEREEHLKEMLMLRQLARVELGRRMLAGLPRNGLWFDVGLACLGWRG